MTDISKQITNLSPEKRKLFEMLLQEEGVEISRSVIVPQKKDPDHLLLSYAQQRLWFLNQLEGNGSEYNIPMAIQMTGELDLPALERSINEVIRRHDIGRTTFRTINGEPRQIIAPELRIDLPVIDLRRLPDSSCEAEAMQLSAEHARKSFDLAKGPLVYATLLRLADHEHLMLLTMHHIVSDGWSMSVINREIAMIYSAFVAGKPSPLPELPIQYVDYAIWQREWLKGDVLNEQLGYWERQLRGLDILEIPTLRPRPPILTTRGAQQSFILPEELLSRLRELSQSEGTTLFMTILAAFQTLLYRYTGSTDISVGTPIANRSRAELEGLIGFFVNTLVLRCDLSGDPNFRELLKRVRKITLEAYDHQDVPFEMVVDHMQPPRDLSHTPLFQVMFSLQKGTSQVIELPGLIMSTVDTHSGTAKFDLTLLMVEGPKRLQGSFEYNVDLFDASTISRMVGHFTTLLNGITDQPDQVISRLSLLTDAERPQLLSSFHLKSTRSSQNICIHQVFETQAFRSPKAIALTMNGDNLTYEEFNRRANQLANYLRKQGVKPDSIVGLLFDRSLEMLVAIMGVLKAGGAYLPLDLSSPVERQSFMLEDASVSILLTEKKLFNSLPEAPSLVICLDTDWSIIAKEDATNLACENIPENLAYVIYTSGSTGKPKGVMVTHANVTRLFTSTQNWYQFDARDVWTLFHSYAFDFSVWEIFGALLYGGRLVIVPYPVSRSPVDFYQLLRKEQVTVLNTTPSAFRQVAQIDESFGAAYDLNLRLVIFGGEALELSILKRWFERHGDLYPRLVNMYGITETTVHVTYRPIFARDVERIPGSVIGNPMPDLDIYILDQHLEPLPIGIPGEIYVGGAGLARGYLNRPDLTAEKFIANPFYSSGNLMDIPDVRNTNILVENENRLYRSGDLARYLPDGDVEYLGRIDQQVKIRGFRIETGEIESVLASHPGVRECAVVAFNEINDDHLTWNSKQLIAFVVPVVGQKPTSNELRMLVKQKLPEYMIPSAFSFLDSIPLTPNGKLDRKALLAPERVEREVESAYVPPRSPEEDTLARIWIELLKIDRVGVYDNFFELGGHSLLATQVISRIRNIFQIEIPLIVLFESPTVASLALYIKKEMVGDKAIEAPILPIKRDQKLPLSFSQQRLWFLDQFEPGTANYTIPSVVRLTGPVNLSALEQGLCDVVQRHEILRTVFTTSDGQPFQTIITELKPPMDIIELSEIPEMDREKEALRRASIIIQEPFDLAKGPLWRAVLMRFAADDAVMIFTMHHIISDGWSTGILMRELVAMYATHASGQPSPMLPLAIQYADYAVWQRKWLEGEILEKQLAYWKEKLGGDLPVLKLPTDRPRPVVQTSRGERIQFSLPSELTKSLDQTSQQEGVTLFMLLIAAYQTLLYRYSGQEDICIGSPVANRSRLETETLIGCFVNTLVLRTDLSDTASFRELLWRVRKTALEAYAHQEIPFEMLVNELSPERDTSRSALFQTMFVLQNLPFPEVQISNLLFKPLSVETHVANFDLTMIMESRGGVLFGALEYNSDCFDAATIARMVEHFKLLLNEIVLHPDQSIARFPLLTNEEKHQVLVEWNDSQMDLIQDRCLHQLFEDQAERTPEAVAVVYQNERMSYQELNQRSNQLAHYLKGLGIGPDQLVGISIERSLDLLVALLGILKAGGAYLPLDPVYPKDRLALMVKDSGVKIIVTHLRLLEKLQGIGTGYVCLDSDWNQISLQISENPINEAAPENLAYVIYTSGSTGQPKGVMVTHQGVVNHNLAVINTFGLNSEDRMLQFATINFDTAVEEIFPTLFVGASLVVRPDDVIPSGAELMELMERERLTVLDLPTAYWQAWVNELSVMEGRLSESLRLVVVGGEKVNQVYYAKWLDTVGTKVRWLNGYGPTEATIIASVYDPWMSQDLPGREVPIGRPIANVQLLILDRYFQPQPIGAVGELWIGGLGVSRGYLNRPELTAENFVPDPFRTGGRIYRTGDLARFRPDGNVEFLGRVDDQIKLRGFRVELGEVETALARHPGVKQVAVAANQGPGGGIQLAAFITPIDQPGPTAVDLAAFLKDRLPDYMLPMSYTFLDILPTTPGGKIDRRQLPKPEWNVGREIASHVAPQTIEERKLVEIWQDVLGITPIGVNDNFFQLGGDSILSIMVVARANKAGLKLTVRQLFETQTINKIARLVKKNAYLNAEQGIVVGDFPLTPIQSWFFEQNFIEAQHWNQTLLIEVQQPMVKRYLFESVRQLIGHHDALRMRFSNSAGGLIQSNADLQVEIPCIWRDLSHLSLDEQRVEIEADSSNIQQSLDLSNGPLFRMIYFDLGPSQGGKLLIVVHHLIVDGVSWRILLEDLQDIYWQISQGMEINLPSKTSSYGEWAHKLEGFAVTNDVLDQLDYWLNVTGDEPQNLPLDFPEGENNELSAQTVRVRLSSSETEGLLRGFSTVFAMGINDVLLSALVVVLQEWTGWKSILVDLESHGREEIFDDIDISRTVGWFTSLYPVKFELSNDKGTSEILTSVKELLRQIPQHGIGFGLLRYLGNKATQAQLSRSVSQISFNYMGQIDPVLKAAPGFKLAEENPGPMRSTRGERSYILEINGGIGGGQLQMEWVYSQNLHKRETVEQLANDYIKNLRKLIAFCLAQPEGYYTPSDFPLIELDQARLDKIVTRVKHSQKREIV